jgi:hypothetical protein
MKPILLAVVFLLVLVPAVNAGDGRYQMLNVDESNNVRILDTEDGHIWEFRFGVGIFYLGQLKTGRPGAMIADYEKVRESIKKTLSREQKP